MLQYLGVTIPPAGPLDPRTPMAGGAAGVYKVVLTLSRPGYPLKPEGQYSGFQGLEGDSHLAIARPAFSRSPDDDIVRIVLQSQTEAGYLELYGSPNSRGFLAQVTVESIPATDAQDARVKVMRAFASSASNISIQLDIPLTVYQADMVELATGNHFMSIVSPYPPVPPHIGPVANLSKEFRSYISFYREALNSNTAVFQFLCYFKIIEGIQERRKRLIAEAKAAGLPINAVRQIVPAQEAEFTPWLMAVYPIAANWDFITLNSIFVTEARGKKFNRVIDDYLRPIRVRIAHAVLDSGESTISADEDLDIQQVYKWVSLTKSIARHMLKSDFPAEFLPYYKPDGA